MNMQDEAARLEEAMRPLAKKLGMRFKVTYDSANFGFYIDSTMLPPPRATTTIDEGIVVRQPAGSTYAADLLRGVAEDLQIRTFRDTAKRMTEHDARGAQYGLSEEDKRVLHAMFMDATLERSKAYDPNRVENENEFIRSARA